jgi:hypothetical protein
VGRALVSWGSYQDVSGPFLNVTVSVRVKRGPERIVVSLRNYV